MQPFGAALLARDHRSAGGSVSVELGPAARRGLSLHGARAQVRPCSTARWTSRGAASIWGLARIIFAGLVVAAISTGLLLGLALLGVSLPVGQGSSRPVPLWMDMAAAGVAVAAYSVFFSTPING